mgnify:CR=1 FL=1
MTARFCFNRVGSRFSKNFYNADNPSIFVHFLGRAKSVIAFAKPQLSGDWMACRMRYIWPNQNGAADEPRDEPSIKSTKMD